MRFGVAGDCSPMDKQDFNNVLVPDVRDDGAFEGGFEGPDGEEILQGNK